MIILGKTHTNKAIFNSKKCHTFLFYSLNLYFYSTSSQHIPVLCLGSHCARDPAPWAHLGLPRKPLWLGLAAVPAGGPGLGAGGLPIRGTQPWDLRELPLEGGQAPGGPPKCHLCPPPCWLLVPLAPQMPGWDPAVAQVAHASSWPPRLALQQTTPWAPGS